MVVIRHKDLREHAKGAFINHAQHTSTALITYEDMTLCKYVGGCYGSIPNYLKGKTPDKLGFFCFHRNCPENSEWLDFTINRSWFKDVFLTKSVEDGGKYGFEVDLTQPFTKVYAGIILLRFIFANHENNLHIWKAFLEKGLSEKEAAILLHMFYTTKHRGEYSLTAWSGQYDHSIFMLAMDVKKVLNSESLFDDVSGLEFTNMGIFKHLPQHRNGTVDPAWSSVFKYLRESKNIVKVYNHWGDRIDFLPWSEELLNGLVDTFRKEIQ